MEENNFDKNIESNSDKINKIVDKIFESLSKENISSNEVNIVKIELTNLSADVYLCVKYILNPIFNN